MGGDFLNIVDYLDIVDIGQCSAACIITMASFIKMSTECWDFPQIVNYILFGILS